MSRIEITKERIELKVAGSGPMGAYTARSANAGPHPGLMVFQEAFGVNSHVRNLTERFAAQGFVAIAPELFHRTAPLGFEGNYGDFPRTHYQAVTTDTVEADVRAAYDWLRSNSAVHRDRISCVGFCMGGRVAVLANGALPLRSAVSFYGGGIAQALLDRAARQHGPILLLWGGLDKHITAEHRRSVIEALNANKRPYVNIEFSNADHGFFCDERAAY